MVGIGHECLYESYECSIAILGVPILYITYRMIPPLFFSMIITTYLELSYCIRSL